MEAPPTIRNGMSIDVEDYFHVAALADSIPRSTWNSMEYRAEANTRRLLQLFADTGVRSTFFVLGWVARRSPELVREIHRAGHEIASHGMSHQLIYTQSPEQFRSETRESKALLEDIIGQEVRGYRAATYSITPKSLWALDVLHEAGFRYDSSIFPIKHDLYGIPDASPAPGFIRTPKGNSLVEFPISTVRIGGMNAPVAGGGYFRILPYALTRAGLRTLNRRNRPFVFYLHPWEIDPSQPRIAARWFSRFRHYTNLQRCEHRLRRLVSDFRFTSLSQVLEDLRLLDVPGAAPLAAAPNPG